MTADQDQGPLDVLACDFRARPRGAPTVFDVQPALRGIDRAGDALVVELDPTASEIVAGYVVAERLCCKEIGWDLNEQPALRLRITGSPAQLDVLERLFRPS